MLFSPMTSELAKSPFFLLRPFALVLYWGTTPTITSKRTIAVKGVTVHELAKKDLKIFVIARLYSAVAIYTNNFQMDRHASTLAMTEFC